jgi:glycosidase
MRLRRRLAVTLCGALLCSTAAALGATPATADHTDPPDRVTVMGDLMDDLGCADAWDTECSLTDMTPTGEGSVWELVADLPPGTYQFKVRLNGGWTENYGAGGVSDGPNVPLSLLAPATLRFTYDHETHRIGVAPAEPAPGLTAADAELARPSLREDLTRERFYFVMADRFENGDPANDTGGIEGVRLDHGFDPTHKGFYHGGDLRGIIDRLDYIDGLGTTAIWLTPSFKNKPVQGTPGDESAGYHGYWITDFTQIDPHLGTNEELYELIDLAHSRGIKVFFDIITNHTADVLDYEDEAYQGGCAVPYRSKAAFPYRDAAGNAFDDRDHAFAATGQQPPFPALGPDSFPYRTFPKAGEEDIKVPAWLNDPAMYHNRGTSSFDGENSEYGDFPGGCRQALDDLFTERPEVVNGMIDIYTEWVQKAGIDGFRIDTVKHVNLEFWQQFGPALEQNAAALGQPDFFMFGEVYDGNPEYLSRFTTEGQLQSVADFGYQANAVPFAEARANYATTRLRDFFAADDYYTDADSNAYSLPTFLGNHDMGRVGMFLRDAGHGGQQLLERDLLAHSLMYLTRGQPVVYYGDEQGFTGDGGDQDARENMFPSQVASYNDNVLIGTGATTAQSNFDTGHPLYRHLSALSALRDAHPALADGAQVHRYATSGNGIYAFSRIDRDQQVEYVVAANNADTAQSASFATYSPRQVMHQVWPAPSGAQGKGTARGQSKVQTDPEGRLSVAVPARSVVVYRATSPVKDGEGAPAPFFSTVSAGGVVGGRAEIGVGIPGNAFREVTFAWRPAGSGADWTVLGTDDNAPYRVFHEVSGMARGTLLEYRAVARDASGELGVTSTYAAVGDPPRPGGGGSGPVGPVDQPASVALPGTHGTEVGCDADWNPACPPMALGAEDGIWKAQLTPGAGNFAFKVAIGGTWEENYGLGAARDGPNIGYEADAEPVRFYYDHRTKWVTNDRLSTIVTVAGDVQSELGCAGDWKPDCMRLWLQDPDGDGVYELSTTEVPAGTWQGKATVNLSWDESYGAGGGGDNVVWQVPADDWITTFRWDSVSKAFDVSVTEPATDGASGPDLSTSRAAWVAPDLVAWDLPDDTRGWTYRLHYGPAGSLGIDAETLGGSSLPLTLDPSGWEGVEGLRLSKHDARQASSVARSAELAVAAYDRLGRLRDATRLTVGDWATASGPGKAAPPGTGAPKATGRR